MLKELNVEEVRKIADNIDSKCESNSILYKTASDMEKGEKIKVKEKITRVSHSIVIYRYDKQLYRYTICGEMFL